LPTSPVNAQTHVPVHTPQVAAQLILEQMQLIYYMRSESRSVSWQKDDALIGIFVWQDFPALDKHGEFKVYKEMRIELDLNGRRFHQGWLTHQSGEVWPLTAEQVMGLCVPVPALMY